MTLSGRLLIDYIETTVMNNFKSWKMFCSCFVARGCYVRRNGVAVFMGQVFLRILDLAEKRILEKYNHFLWEQPVFINVIRK